MTRRGERTLRLMSAPIGGFLADGDTTEVVINRPGEVGVERHGRWTWHDVPELDFDRLDGIATLAAAMMKQDVGPDRPLCGSFMPDGERIQICRPPASADGIVSLTIRKPPGSAPSLDMLADGGLFATTDVAHHQAHPLDAELVELHRARDWRGFFPLAVRARKNIIACGATGSGKSTTLAESGAIAEYLVERFGDGKLSYQAGGDADRRFQYLYWLHWAEVRLLVPSLVQPRLIFPCLGGGP